MDESVEDEGENPLDDELLKELGLEPKQAPRPVSKPVRPPEGKSGKPTGPLTGPAGGPLPGGGAIPEKAAPQAPATSASGGRSLARDMPVQIVAVLGKKTMSLADAISLKQGEIVDFKKLPHDLVDLVANGKLVGRGELVVIDGKLGIQIKQLVS